VTGKRQKHNKFLGNFLGMDFGGGKFFSANLSSATIIKIKGNLQKFWQFAFHQESWAARKKKF
jgi:hypothetical protein